MLILSFFQSLCIPNALKIGVVTPLYKKKGKKNQSSSYRPISNIPFIAKIVERLIFSRLSYFCESKLINQQHGLRKGRSCETAVSILAQNISNIVDQRKRKALALFLDLRKAFDSVSIPILISKLPSFNFPPDLQHILASYLTNRKILIKTGSHSKLFSLFCGVPQGSILSPLLFALYINDVGSYLTHEFLLYADDLVIIFDISNNPNPTELVSIEIEKFIDW